MSALTAAGIAALRRQVRGRLLFPADLDWTDTVTGHDLAAVHAPSVVVEATCGDDVVAAVRVAATHGVRVGTHLTGHGAVTGQRGGVLVATRALDTVDVSGDRMRVGAGVRWDRAIEAAAAHGLAPVCANALDLGVVGFTLGGGVGPLGRRHGWAADHVTAVDVVTGDGHARRVDADTDPELFWALRGGKVGLGVVTAMELALVPAPTVLGGSVVLDASAATDVLAVAAERCARNGTGTTVTATLLRVPDLDVAPPPLRGRTLVQVTVVDVDGEGRDGRATLDAVAAVAEPVLASDVVGDLRAVLAQHGDGGPAMPTWQAGRLLSGFDAAAATAVVDAFGPGTPVPLLAVQVRQLGGALDRPVDDAVGGRGAAYLLNVLGAPVPELFAGPVPAAAHAVFAAAGPWSDGRSQANFHGPVTADTPLELCWDGPTNVRLAEVRRRFDPVGVLRPDGIAANRSAEAAGILG